MTNQLRPYAAYKASGFEWLGKVPAHWQIRQLGRIGRFFKGGGGTKEDEREDGVPCIRYGDLYTRHRFFITESRACVTPELARTAYTPIRYGDVLFAGSGETIDEIGKSAVNLIRGPACCGGDVIVFRPSIDVDARFLAYATDCPPAARQKACLGRGFTVMHIYWSDLKYMTVVIPPLPEQVAIVRFLDYADRRIGRYLRAKQKLITLLEEQKEAIIHEAVTGRIDVRTGRLYPAYRDSGWEWLGEVPEHWEVIPLGRALTQRKERNDPIKTTDILSLSLETGVIPYAEKRAGGNKAKEDISGYMLAYPGDIVVNSMNVVVGSVGLSKYFGAVSPVYYMLRPRRENDIVEYFEAVFQDVGFQRSLFGLGNGIMFIESRSSGKLNTIRLRIPMTRLKRVFLPYPATCEQAGVVKYLNEATAETDIVRARVNREIDLLREYRTRLIADVVTGKLDVRDAAAGLPEVDPLAAEGDHDYDVQHEAGSERTGRHAVEAGSPLADVSHSERSEAEIAEIAEGR